MTEKTESKTVLFEHLERFVVLGFFAVYFFIPAMLSVLGYVVIDRNYLRCRTCGGFTNLDRLYYAKNHTYHCSHCGERIHITK